MTGKIDWMPGILSAHERLQVTASLERLEPLAQRIGFVTFRSRTSGTCLQFLYRDGSWEQTGIDDGLPESLDCPTDETRAVGIGTMYRDMNNYKTGGLTWFRGPCDPDDLDLVLTALFSGHNDLIPHQVALTEWQIEEGWQLDYSGEGTDHPWHTLTGIEIRDAQGDERPFADLLAAARRVLETGFDEISAMAALEEMAGARPDDLHDPEAR